jgi:dihydroneopterin triphosphate diphosphatase
MTEIPVRCLSVSVVVLRVESEHVQVLLLRRNRTLAGEWCQVAGGIEEGELAWQTALREVKEETCLECRLLYTADICEQFYEVDRNAISILPVFVGFADASSQVVLNSEHSEYCWVSFDKAIELVPFSGQRQVLRHIQAEFVLREPVKHLQIHF